MITAAAAKAAVPAILVGAWIVVIGAGVVHGFMDAPRAASEEVRREDAQRRAALHEEARLAAEREAQAAAQAAKERAEAVKADRERKDYCERLRPWRPEAARFERLARWELLRRNYPMATVWQRRADELRASGAACD